MGFFNKIKEAFQKKIYEVFTAKQLDEDFYDELEATLISADLGAEASSTIIENFKDKCFEHRVKTPNDAIALLKETMIESIDYEVEPYTYPLIILVAGVNGVGKTTAVGKMARYSKNLGKSVVIAAADTFRAAAVEQLEIWAQRSGSEIVKKEEGSDPASVVFEAIQRTKESNADVLIVDTAGRLHNKKYLMDELFKIKRVIEKEMPEASKEVLLVLDAETGQNAILQVKAFKETTDITGIVLTKLDGTAKGGVVLGIVAENQIPVKFVGVGEQIDDMEIFNSNEFLDAII